jgi:hypothetical protein
MIGIGINENVILKNCEITTGEGGKISIDFNLTDTEVSEETTDNFAEDKYDENGMIITGSGGRSIIKVWPISVPEEKDTSGAVKTTAVRIAEALDATKELQNLFMSFLKYYKPISEIKFDRFAGLNITAQTTANLLNEEVLVAVTKNLANQFIEMVRPFLNDPSVRLRVLLVRQSAAKAFPTFRRRFLSSNPIVESMAVPKEASKLAFTNYEVTKGLNSNAPSATAVDANKEPEAPKDAASLFGNSTPIQE